MFPAPKMKATAVPVVSNRGGVFFSHMLRFTDNRPEGFHKVDVQLSASAVAAHLLLDPQFAFYFREGHEVRTNAERSLWSNPPEKGAICCTITDAQWPELISELANLNPDLVVGHR